MAFLRSLKWRLLAYFLAPALALFGIAGWAGYAVSRKNLEDELGRSLSAIAAAGASQLNGRRVLSVEPGDEQQPTRTYRNLLRTLQQIQKGSGLRRMVAFDLNGRARVDTASLLPVGAEVPELSRDRLELQRVLSGGLAASQVLFEGNDGRLYKTGYAPLMDGDEVLGGVAAEGSAEFFGPLRSLFQGYLVLSLSALCVLAAVALLTSRAVAAPLQRLMAAALRIGRGDLSTPVQPERTLEIGVLARELEWMRQALESRDRQLKMMLAGVAHEVRNPIGGIELFSGLLAEDLGPGSHDAHQHVQRIQGEIAYLKRIVEDFLGFAREHRVSPSPVSAAELLQSAAELMQSDAQGKQVTLQIRVEPAQLEADNSLLTAALVNLVKNAVQAAPQQSVVELSGERRSDRYVISVQDTGSGIPSHQQNEIFEPFFTTREKGTGLGLPLAQKIVQAHGGDLTVSSRPGETRFQIILPAIPALKA